MHTINIHIHNIHMTNKETCKQSKARCKGRYTTNTHNHNIYMASQERRRLKL